MILASRQGQHRREWAKLLEVGVTKKCLERAWRNASGRIRAEAPDWRQRSERGVRKRGADEDGGRPQRLQSRPFHFKS